MAYGFIFWDEPIMSTDPKTKVMGHCDGKEIRLIRTTMALEDIDSVDLAFTNDEAAIKVARYLLFKGLRGGGKRNASWMFYWLPDEGCFTEVLLVEFKSAKPRIVHTFKIP